MDLVERAEERRKTTLAGLNPEEQADRGQYFTPLQAARIMAGLPRIPEGRVVRILDPGAGIGILAAALVERLRSVRPDLEVRVTAVEDDPILHPALTETLADIEGAADARCELVEADFVPWALGTAERYDIVIQNPPYAKLRSGTPRQNQLRSAGIDVPNIYAAFLALGVRLLDEGGQQVAITPRSWMNGTYYSPFRRSFVQSVGIDSIHTFESRSKVFGDTGVLQESIIVSATATATATATAGRAPATVTLYTSHDHRDEPTSRTVPYTDVVTPDFIHVPATAADAQAVAWMAAHATCTLSDLGLTVSTGRVVDFRSRELLHRDKADGDLPMVHSSHLRHGKTIHPVGAKKPEWFQPNHDGASKLLIPGGTYVLTKRFSAKEERRRVVAAVWESSEAVALDNKLNYFHQDGHGLEDQVARGLAVFLNSTQLDNYFRVFSGHTQVNATDLRQLRFPSAGQLRTLAAFDGAGQLAIDNAVEEVLAPLEVTA